MGQNASNDTGLVPVALPRFPPVRVTQNFDTHVPAQSQPGIVVNQHFQPGSIYSKSSFNFNQPGTYNVGVSFNSSAGAGVGGSQETRPPPLTPPTTSDWAQAPGAFHNPSQGPSMGSQKSPGLMGNADQGQSSSQGQGNQGSLP